MKAVLWTDTFQTTMMIVGLLATLIQGCIEMGGFTNAWQIAKDNQRVYFDEYVKICLFNRSSNWTFQSCCWYHFIHVWACKRNLRIYWCGNRTLSLKHAVYLIYPQH
jgi:Na+/proline symporter